MTALRKLKNWFRSEKEAGPSYKHAHFLNSLGVDKVDEIVVFSEADQLAKLVPSLDGKKVLFLNDQKHKFLFKKIMAKEPRYFVNYIFKGKPVSIQSPDCFTVMGNIDKLSFKNQFFDIIICPLSLCTEEASSRFIESMCQLLTNGGRIIFSVRHPQLEHVLFNQNPAATGNPDNSVSSYFDILKKHHFYTEEMSEGLVDMALKPFFTLEGEYDHYHEYKALPLTYLVKAVKFMKASK